MYYICNWVYTTNHKRIAVNYFWFVILSGIVGMVLATVIRLEFAYPGVGVFAGDSIQYLSLASAHGVIMVFFMIMPLLFGAFANFLLPTQLGVHDVAFPRLNSAAFWFLPGGLLMLCQLVCIDRRYQRMNCFNIREVQSLLKRKFFTDLINTSDSHTLMNKTTIGLRFKTQNINSINSNFLLNILFEKQFVSDTRDLFLKPIKIHTKLSTSVASIQEFILFFFAKCSQNFTLLIYINQWVLILLPYFLQRDILIMRVFHRYATRKADVSTSHSDPFYYKEKLTILPDEVWYVINYIIDYSQPAIKFLKRVFAPIINSQTGRDFHRIFLIKPRFGHTHSLMINENTIIDKLYEFLSLVLPRLYLEMLNIKVITVAYVWNGWRLPSRYQINDRLDLSYFTDFDSNLLIAYGYFPNLIFKFKTSLIICVITTYNTTIETLKENTIFMTFLNNLHWKNLIAYDFFKTVNYSPSSVDSNMRSFISTNAKQTKLISLNTMNSQNSNQT
jgi:hypothetical protein